MLSSLVWQVIALAIALLVIAACSGSAVTPESSRFARREHRDRRPRCRRSRRRHSYGLVLLSDIANLLYLLAGSPWDVTDPRRANLSFWKSDGFAPLLYKGAMMDMVRGRAISRNSSPDHAIGHSTIASLLRITQFAPEDEAAALRSAIKRWLTDDTSRDFSSNLPLDLIGEARRILDDDTIAPADLPSPSRVYASMDRALHLRPAWAAGIAMHSTRIYNYESINNENLQAWHTGDGMTYLYNAI